MISRIAFDDIRTCRARRNFDEVSGGVKRLDTESGNRRYAVTADQFRRPEPDQPVRKTGGEKAGYNAPPTLDHQPRNTKGSQSSQRLNQVDLAILINCNVNQLNPCLVGMPRAWQYLRRRA